jgi:hypothetical protein
MSTSVGSKDYGFKVFAAVNCFFLFLYGWMFETL